MRDIFDRPIRVNDVVVYPVRKRSRQRLATMRVTDVQPGRLGGWLPSGRHATIWGAETLRQIAVIRGATLQAATWQPQTNTGG